MRSWCFRKHGRSERLEEAVIAKPLDINLYDGRTLAYHRWLFVHRSMIWDNWLGCCR